MSLQQYTRSTAAAGDRRGRSPLRRQRADDVDAGSTSSVFNGVRLTTSIIPARNALQGGDWCETIRVSECVVALSIGDVCGHGAAAFPIMKAMRQLARDAVGQGLSPTQILANLNSALCGDESHLYATAILALLDTRLHKLTFANAGHPRPLVTGPSGQWFLGPRQGSLPLGIESTASSPAQNVGFPADALVVFYTDGVVARRRNVLAGLTKLRNAAKTAYRNGELSAASVIERQMLLMSPNEDDASILTART